MGFALERKQAMNQRTPITEAIAAALAQTILDNGAATDIGRAVYIAQQFTNEHETPCAIVTPGNETPPDDSGPNAHVYIGYTLTAYVNRHSVPVPEHELVDNIIDDIRNTIEGDACTFDEVADNVQYLGARPIYHEAGAEFSGAELRYMITTPHIGQFT